MNIIGSTSNGKFAWPTASKNQMKQWALDNPNCQFYMVLHRMPEDSRNYTREYYFAGVVGTLRKYVEDCGDVWSEHEAHDYLKEQYGGKSTKEMDDQEYWNYMMWARRKVMDITESFIPPPKNFS